MNGKPAGFTLIEAIMALVVISITSTLAGMGLVQIANGYIFAKKNTAIAQQAQIALIRLSKELSAIQSVSSATAASLTYKRAGATHTLAWTAADQPLTLDGDTLIDKVQSFSMTYYSYDYATQTFTAASYSPATAVLQVTLQMKGYPEATLVFTDRIAL